MKNFLLTAIIFTLTGFAPFAKADFFQCTLPQADEYRVGIDLKKNIAGFFDNDTTSIMKYRGFRKSTSNPNQTVVIFSGKDSGGDGHLQLEFNTSTKRVKLSTLETDGTIELLGYAPCASETAWNWSVEDLAVQ